MKKMSSIIFFSLLLLTVSSCQNETTETSGTTGTTGQTTAPVAYNDGEYEADGDKREYGYEDATVTIENGIMTKLVLRRKNPDGTTVNWAEWGAGTDKPNLAQIRYDIAEQMLEKQSPDVDAVAGATDSSVGWMQAVERALEKAKI